MSAVVPPSFFSTSAPIAIVSGGAGFIGSFVCEALLAKGVRVICVDNWQTGLRRNISAAIKNPDFFLLELDINSGCPKQIERADYVIDLAGQTSPVGTKNLLEFTRDHGGRFLLVSSDQHEALVAEHTQKHASDGRVVRLGDVYGPRMFLSGGSPIARLIKACLYHTPAVLPSQDTGIVYPVFIVDVVAGIVKSLLSAGTKGKIITLAGQGISTTSIAQVLKGIYPRLEVVFSQTDGFAERPALSEAALAAPLQSISWQPTTPLPEGLVRTVDWFVQHKQPETGKGGVASVGFWEQTKVLPKRRHAPIWFAGLAIFLLAFLFFGIPFVYLGAGLGNLYIANKKLASLDQAAVKKWGTFATFWFERSADGFLRWSRIPGFASVSLSLANKSQLLGRFAAVLQKTTDVSDAASTLLESVLHDGLPIGQTSQKLTTELSALERELAFLEAAGQADRRLLRQSVLTLAQISPQLPVLFGQEGKKTYALVVQDQRVVWPTGGTITSFGLLTFEKGRLTTVNFQPVQAADQQLPGHVPPPTPLGMYAKMTSWKLAWANWSPDFPTTARRIIWFVDKELGEQVDGVLLVDLDLLVKLLTVYGPVDIQAGQINTKNFYQKVAVGQEGGSVVAAALEQLFQTADQDKGGKALLAVREAIALLGSKKAVLFTGDSQADKVLDGAGWDGAIKDVRCTPKANGCLADYLYPVETNLNGQLSTTIDRAYSLDILLEQDKITHRLLVAYKNTGGEYANYFRVIIPTASNAVSGFLLDPVSGDQEELKVEIEPEGTKKSAGVFIKIPAGQQRQVIISWEAAAAVGQVGEFVLGWQKQASVTASPVWVKINFGEGYHIVGSAAFAGSQSLVPTLTQDTSVGYNSQLDQDLIFKVIWQK